MEQPQTDKIFDTYFNGLNLKTRTLKKAEHLFNQGESINFIFYIRKGMFNVIKDKKILWQAKENEFIGISSFFSDDETYSYTVRACVDSEVVLIPIGFFEEKIKGFPELNTYLMKIFCDRIKSILHKRDSVSYLTKKRKVVQLLIKEIKKERKAMATYNIEDLTKRINVPIQIVIDILKDLQNKHIVKLNNNKIEIIDTQALELVL